MDYSANVDISKREKTSKRPLLLEVSKSLPQINLAFSVAS